MEDDKNATWKSVILAIALALIAAGPPTLMALATFNKTGETHDLVNSRMTEMLTVVRSAATAEATLKEKADEKARQGAAAEAELSQLPNRIAVPGHVDKQEQK